MKSFYINPMPTRIYAGMHWKAGNEPEIYTVIRDCKKKIHLRKPKDNQQGGGKTHIICEPCNLVWVRTIKGRIYCHAYKVNGVIYNKIPREERIAAFEEHHRVTGQAI